MSGSRAAQRRLERRAAELAGCSWGWQEHAVCRQESQELFFGPEGEKPTQRADRERRAVEVCARCPVLEACRSHAQSLPEAYGVWGATTEEQRSSRRRKVASPAA